MSSALPTRSANTSGVSEAHDIASTPVMKAQNLSLYYPGCTEPAVRNVSMELNAGERVALIGSSGSGKTSLLRMLEGSVQPTSGSLTLQGKLALVYQDQRLVVERDVLTNVCSGAIGEVSALQSALGFSTAIRERASQILTDLGMGALAHQRVSSLSGGQRQRVAIARALCARPQILLADEPLSALDPENGQRVLQLLGSLQEKYGFALVVTTHDLGYCREFFPRFLRMEGGALEDIAPPDTPASTTPPTVNAPLDNPASPAQDRALGDPGTLMDKRRSWLLGGLLIAALGWAAAGVGLSLDSFQGLFTELAAFSKGFLPQSLEALVALPWTTLSVSLLQTIQMALWGTVIGVVLSFPLGVLAARELGPPLLRPAVRFLLNVVRTVPSIFWALVFVAMLGLGPVSGIFALGAYSTGYLTKFFYEGLEDVDGRAAAALKALGASRLQSFALAIFPAARPVLTSSCFFMFEYNIRAASILGVVGAGGIGQDLMYYMEWRQFPAATAGLTLLLVIVVGLDTLSERLRKRLAQQRGR
ncbi:MAG: phosphonate ABC transporter, permease protein PhnE [Myxococcota bacterium]|nr:phosphonate ABC transporter, permease protein PhnE [Myxococcota bacterium]